MCFRASQAVALPLHRAEEELEVHRKKGRRPKPISLRIQPVAASRSEPGLDSMDSGGGASFFPDALLYAEILPLVADAFPNARMVFTHRDPAPALADAFGNAIK
eukprot:gene16388-biopygen1209